MKRTHYDEFEISDVVLVPYQHHRNKLVWLVQAIDGERINDFHVCAEEPDEAVKFAYNSYQKFLVEEMKYLEMKEEQKEAAKELAEKELETDVVTQ